MGQLKFMNMCLRCKRVSQEQMRFWSSLETRPYNHNQIIASLMSDEFTIDSVNPEAFFDAQSVEDGQNCSKVS